MHDTFNTTYSQLILGWYQARSLHKARRHKQGGFRTRTKLWQHWLYDALCFSAASLFAGTRCRAPLYQPVVGENRALDLLRAPSENRGRQPPRAAPPPPSQWPAGQAPPPHGAVINSLQRFSTRRVARAHTVRNTDSEDGIPSNRPIAFFLLNYRFLIKKLTCLLSALRTGNRLQ